VKIVEAALLLASRDVILFLGSFIRLKREKGAWRMPLTIHTKQVPPDVVVLEMTGRITLGNDCQQVEWTTNKLVAEQKKKIIFDLSGITHVDSTGIGIIVMVAGQMKKAGGGLRVAGANQHVEQMLKVTSVDQIVGLHPTIAAAAADF